jgi:hypothetical protein
MSTASSPASEPRPQTRALQLRLAVPEMWASLAITVMWLVVLLDALFGPDIEVRSAAGDYTHLPSVVIVAFFAFLGTWVVARHGFRRSDDRAG